MRERFTGLTFQIDTNRINSRQNEENMNILEGWANDGVISMEMSNVARIEASAGNDTDRTKKANNHIYSLTYAITDVEKTILKKIEKILFPNGTDTQNKLNDVEIVFNAYKYGHILITNDGNSKSQPKGILGNSEILFKDLNIRVMTDAEAVAKVKNRIKIRDEICRRRAKETDKELPVWIGND